MAELATPLAPPALLAPVVSPPLSPHAGAGVDLILEGFLLHHGRPRTRSGDPAEHVLAGDECYAQGLVQVATANDLTVVELLADLIAVSAGLVASDQRDALAALWAATILAIAQPEQRSAVAAARGALTDRRDLEPCRSLAEPLPWYPNLTEVFSL